MRFDEYSYHSLARVYDRLAALYSLGQIGASKRVQLESIRHGDRVLYAGAGAGEEILLAARLGARITAIDLADNMIARIATKLANEGLSAELICGDVAEHASTEAYDVVVANYFLNLFDREHAVQMIRHLCGLVAPGGTLVLTDFALPEGGLFARMIAEVYYRPVNWISWALGFCARHPILNHEKLLEGTGFRISSSRRFPVLFGQTPAYWALVARRCDEGRVG